MSAATLSKPSEFGPSNDWHAIKVAIQIWAASPVATEQELVHALSFLPAWRTKFTDAFHLEHAGETITWFRYESLIWALGEAFRQILKAHKALRRRAMLFERVQAVCLNNDYGKGRESFTMLLGQYGGSATVPTLIALLRDAEVCGHAVYALRLLGACVAIEHVKPFLQHPKTWIRTEARKFFAKCERHENI